MRRPTGGRSATRRPLRGRDTTSPRRRRSANAAATVDGLTSSVAASDRTEGSAAPGGRAPAVTAASTLPAISRVVRPTMVGCSGTVPQLYQNR